MKRSLLLLPLMTSAAHATPRVLPFTYPYETPAEGSLEAEQYVDMVPVRVAKENPDGTLDSVYGMRMLLQTELEYAVTDRLEVALYFAFRQGASPDTPFMRFQGLKQRARYRFAERDEWPLDVGLYLEIAEYHNEVELEEKILLSKRFGRLAVVANLWVEQEYYWQTRETKYIYNPTLGVTYEISPRLSIGAEYWARGRFDRGVDLNDIDGTSEAATSTVHYTGPTALVQRGKLFVSVGAYVRLEKVATAAVAGDPFGKLWIRTIVGVDL